MAADMWIQLGFLTMAFLGGELGGVILMGYILAWRDNRANNKPHRTYRTYKENAGTDGAARDARPDGKAGA